MKRPKRTQDKPPCEGLIHTVFGWGELIDVNEIAKGYRLIHS